MLINNRSRLKFWPGLLIAVLLMLSGCGGQASQYPQRSPGLPAATDKRMPGLDEVITDPNIKADKNLAHDESIQELKHLKYGLRPGEGIDVPSATPDESAGTTTKVPVRPRISAADEPYSQVNIKLLTIEEMDALIAELIKLEYLQQKPSNEEELRDALRQFQSDHDLAPSGEIDTDTLDLIMK